MSARYWTGPHSNILSVWIRSKWVQLLSLVQKVIQSPCSKTVTALFVSFFYIYYYFYLLLRKKFTNEGKSTANMKNEVLDFFSSSIFQLTYIVFRCICCQACHGEK